jgi:hypothetical protein
VIESLGYGQRGILLTVTGDFFDCYWALLFRLFFLPLTDSFLDRLFKCGSQR